MERIDKILEDDEYRECLKKIAGHEKKRKFCHHDLAHFMDVARIAYILTLENNMKVSRELVYAIGLLHDIGRHIQYENKTRHEKASAVIARPILERCGYNRQETELIVSCILNHRNKENEPGSLEELIYKADKMSRACYGCKACEECDWSVEKKNMNIKY